MKKTIFILTLLFALAATPALANQGRGTSNEHANDHAKSNIIEDIEVSPTPIQSGPTEVTPTEVTPTNVTPSPSKQPCDPDDEYENHGKYVSCVARSHQGGKITSEAAKSDIGKKHHLTPSPSVSPSVSPTISITPTASPSVSPTEEPTPTGTASGETTETGENNALNQQIQSIIQALTNLIESLKNLL